MKRTFNFAVTKKARRTVENNEPDIYITVKILPTILLHGAPGDYLYRGRYYKADKSPWVVG